MMSNTLAQSERTLGERSKVPASERTKGQRRLVPAQKRNAPSTLVLHFSVGHEERSVHTKDGAVDDRVLEVEPRQVVADTNTVGHGEVPVLPEALAVVQDDTLTEVVGRVADELDAVAERLAVRGRFLVPVVGEGERGRDGMEGRE